MVTSSPNLGDRTHQNQQVFGRNMAVQPMEMTCWLVNQPMTGITPHLRWPGHLEPSKIHQSYMFCKKVMYDSLISPREVRFKASMWILSLANYHLCLGRPGFLRNIYHLHVLFWCKIHSGLHQIHRKAKLVHRRHVDLIFQAMPATEHC